MTKHTLGPWKYATNVGPTKALIVETDGSTVVEIFNRTHDSRFEANARLIAAAPELLAEAIELLKNATFEDGQGTILTQDAEALQAAIARATG